MNSAHQPRGCVRSQTFRQHCFEQPQAEDNQTSLQMTPRIRAAPVRCAIVPDSDGSLAERRSGPEYHCHERLCRVVRSRIAEPIPDAALLVQTAFPRELSQGRFQFERGARSNLASARHSPAV